MVIIMKTIIHTDRLILRPWREEDIMPFSSINKDLFVMEYMPNILTTEETALFMNKMVEHYIEYGFGVMALTLKDTQELVGYIGLKNVAFESHFTPAVEIAWRLGSQYWGKGFATEGAKACLDYGFNQIGLEEIVSFTVPDNIRSIKVMERIGMIRDVNGDFSHPKLPLNYKLSKHVLYRKER
ncbi:MAG: N-acetyltransferase [Candidatus Midichloriaceae bacterium]|jgi:RimJ/RimL family protein N-acetyltransferase|nr:N-acetyltransferase [Candidatus Midichloriaceae bacterium]